jgi:hypothetical protein
VFVIVPSAIANGPCPEREPLFRDIEAEDELPTRETDVEDAPEEPTPTTFDASYSGSGDNLGGGEFPLTGTATGTVIGAFNGSFTITIEGSGTTSEGLFTGTISGAITGTLSATYGDFGSGAEVTELEVLIDGATVTDAQMEITWSDPDNFTFSGTIEGTTV